VSRPVSPSALLSVRRGVHQAEAGPAVTRTSFGSQLELPLGTMQTLRSSGSNGFTADSPAHSGLHGGRPRTRRTAHINSISGRTLATIWDSATSVWQTNRPALEDPDNSYLPLVDSALGPGPAASRLRDTLGYGSAPVESVVDVLRRLNVLVGALPDDTGAVDAFSCWFHDDPVVLVRDHGAGRRRVRFEAAHELGHVLLHGWGDDQHAEEDADEFASEFLLPAVAMRSSAIFKPFKWATIHELAHAYGIPTLAVLRQAKQRGLLSDVVYAAAHLDAARRGWYHQEPSDTEVPELVSAGAFHAVHTRRTHPFA
jgi:Zn-dependent peptidase ImmA (M78 family)